MLAGTYVGSKNFHNFTSQRAPHDPSCKRFIISVNVENPRIVDNMEWISVKIHGQSFMFHQIRKMIGLVTMVMRTGAGPEVFDLCFSSSKVHVPVAPGVGLFLNQAVFRDYSGRLERSGLKPLDFEKYKVFFQFPSPSTLLADFNGLPFTFTQPTVDKFKKEVILQLITRDEFENQK